MPFQLCGGSFAHAAAVEALGSQKAPETMVLTPDKVETVGVKNVQRVAIGNPEIADVTIVSPDELLIQARRTGSTNLLVWDDNGKREIFLTIGDSKPLAAAQELKRLLSGMQGLEDVKVDLQIDKVFLTGTVDTDEQLAAVESLVAGFEDTTTSLVTKNKEPKNLLPLIQLSVRVLELNEDDQDELGVDWNDSIGVLEETMPAASLRDTLMRVGRSNQRTQLFAILSALVEKNKARLLSEPKLVTISGKEATSFIGVEVPYLKTSTIGSSTDSISVSIDYRQIGVILKMTPSVHLTHQSQAGKITTALETEVSDINTTVGLSVPVGTSTILVPGFQVRRAKTEVTTDSGETIFIAGLLSLNESDNSTQVPGLGSIPVLGRLFRTPTLSNERTELIVMVTPEIVADPSKEEAYRQALDQARSASSTVVASTSDPYVTYAQQVREKILAVVTYPDKEKSLKIAGSVSLRLKLLSDGKLDRLELARSSGVQALDLAAVKAAKSQAPYPAFPAGLSEKEVWLEIPVIFKP